jgi:UDP-glucose 4-epimerase
LFWQDRPVLVTGGASFIGSHLIDALVERGARVRAVDNLSSGTVANLQEHVGARRVEWIEGDLMDADTVRRSV